MVGSIAVPSDTVEEAMGIAAEHVGDRLFAIPDGEVGLRRMWAPALGPMIFYDHPDIVQVDEDSDFKPIPAPIGPLGGCRIRPGVDEVDLGGLLPYAEAAISSYEHLLELRARG